ncbi:MAG TPA: OmpW family outer membrane protein [SAR86 cluster bacterium]|jgi:outer membrane protein|nr:hypothetical protein [Gammaproteobacteria bacterium]MDP6181703.1 OmpW family outer membrane protein [SAR86 cluster bacterium]HJM14755.1 OmpW family outer membrane protein [SAR86 cluster bacterium]HJM59576.1 OmpW family outer membrane protein [SAR86 cluster bacterium]
MKKLNIRALGFFASILILAAPLHAIEKGDWIIRAGYTNIDPVSDNGDIVSVHDKSNLTATFAYLVSDNVGIEVLAGLPFEHDIYDKALNTGLKIGSGKHLPPTVSLQYYFTPKAKIRPYIGLGLNYTFFFKEETSGPLSGASLDLGSSTGLVYQFGIDWQLENNVTFNLDVRKFNLETKANVTNIDNSSLVDVLPATLSFDTPLDPVTIGIGLTWVF